MKWARFIFLVLVVGACIGYWVQAHKPAPQNAAAVAGQTRFGWVDVSVDSGKEPLGAYQFELAVEKGTASIVGLEGGEHPAFAAAPYYDPAALQKARVIVAAYSVADTLPTGKTRVARVMVEMQGDAGFAVKLMKTYNKDGREIPAKVEFTQGDAQ